MLPEFLWIVLKNAGRQFLDFVHGVTAELVRVSNGDLATNLEIILHHYRPGIERGDSVLDLCLSGWDAQQGV